MAKIPNLDKMGIAELRAFYVKYSSPKRKDAEDLLGGRKKGYMKTTAKLAEYAINRAASISCAGDFLKIVSYNERCKALKGELPEDLSW